MKPQRRPRRAVRAHAPTTSIPQIVPAAAPILDEPSAVEQPFAEGAAGALDADLRHRLISETAFHRLEERGFADGNEVDDWTEAEAEVDHTVVRPSLADDTD